MPIRQVHEARVPVKIWTDDVDEKSLAQLKNTAAMPFVFKHVVAMPDVHLGIGATVGSVIATKGAICPAAVGVDIGCGMMAALTGVSASKLDGKLPALRHSIERGVPVGFDSHGEPLAGAVNWLNKTARPHVATDAELKKSAHQLGTLGGGNHFIEVCTYGDSPDPLLAVMLHSGSRGIGSKTAQKYIEKAKGVMKQMFISLPDPDLAYFASGTEEWPDYMEDLQWCQDYAAENRRQMMDIVMRQIRFALDPDWVFDGETINCHHNYVSWENHYGENVMVTRKGAIRARKGDMGIIPGSMGAASYIVRGLGNAESFDSAPHGAGRRMSRTQARKQFTVEDFAVQTAGVECRKDVGVLDEIPGAYKPIGEVMDNASDLVEVVAKLKQILCVKG